MSSLYFYISGAISMAAAVTGFFFLEFWVRTRERIFLVFGVSFFVMALERAVLVISYADEGDDHPVVYLLRLFAFLIIIAGIVDRNRADRRRF